MGRKYEVDDMQVMIHPMKVEEKCKAISISLMKSQSTESNVFLRSTFRMHLGDDLFLSYYLRRSSCRKKMISTMPLFCMNAA